MSPALTKKMDTCNVHGLECNHRKVDKYGSDKKHNYSTTHCKKRVQMRSRITTLKAAYTAEKLVFGVRAFGLKKTLIRRLSF